MEKGRDGNRKIWIKEETVTEDMEKGKDGNRKILRKKEMEKKFKK